MPVLQKKALFSAFIICQVLRIIQNYMEVSPAKSLILSATIHGGSYFFIQPEFVTQEFVNLVHPFFLPACVIIWTNSYSFLGFTIFNGCLSGLMQRRLYEF